METPPVHAPRGSRAHRLIASILATALAATAASSAGSDKAGGLWDGLRADMPADEVAAYLNSQGVRAVVSTQNGVSFVRPKDRERIAGMKGEMSLGFARTGLQMLSYDIEGVDLPDYETVVARLARSFGEPVGRFAPRLYRGPNGDSASAHAFFGGPPRSVSVFYRSFCASYARRRPNEKSLSITIDLRPIAFPPPRLQFTGDADGWCPPG